MWLTHPPQRMVKFYWLQLCDAWCEITVERCNLSFVPNVKATQDGWVTVTAECSKLAISPLHSQLEGPFTAWKSSMQLKTIIDLTTGGAAHSHVAYSNAHNALTKKVEGSASTPSGVSSSCSEKNRGHCVSERDSPTWDEAPWGHTGDSPWRALHSQHSPNGRVWYL